MNVAELESPRPVNREWVISGTAIVAWIAIAKFLVQMLTAGRYGYFGDELYYLACAEHLDWGYVDHPPFIVLVGWVVRNLFGTSLVALHLVPALAGAVKVFMGGMIARELGGGRFAQALAAVAVLVPPVYLAIDHLFSMNTLEPVIWMGCALLVIRIIKTGNQRLWLWFGVLAGIGLQTKYSMGVFGLAVVVALLLTPERRAFREKWIWIAGAIAFAIFLPNLIWNIQHDWPFLELMRNIRESGRDVALGPVAYFVQQIMTMNPLTFPIWLAGVVWLLAARDAKRFRALGWIFAVTFAFFMLSGAKDYYTAPVYPIALAAGAIVVERAIAATRQRWLQPASIAILLAFGAHLAPMVIPILSPEKLIHYMETLPYPVRASERSHMEAALPHHFAWSFGWEEMVAETARVYHNLTPAERTKTAIFANNFAQGGAIDLFGPQYGLPKAVGSHQNYFLWGPRDYTGEIVIILGSTPEESAEWFESIEVAAELHHPYARPSENGPILVGRGLKADLRVVWPRLKSWG